MRILLLLIALFPVIHLRAGTIAGRITDDKNRALPNSSVTIKGTMRGTTANKEGDYRMVLNEGEYLIVIQHIGYKTIERNIFVGKQDLTLNFQLEEQQYELGNVVVKQGEDPAYAIIRNVIKKRKHFEREIKKFETEVYIKGQLQMRDYPKKFLGKEVDFEDGDTSKKKMVFLSETVARYSVDEPKKKVEVISTKVSGDKDAFGFGNPQIFSFYQNTIQLEGLNPRGFISPVSDNAMHYYRYKFQGSFFENNRMINRIMVIPKRKYEPVFSGYINIIENEWRIHSVDLVLVKENQMQLVDTLTIQQLYIPSKNVWLIKQQMLSPAIKMLGFDMTGTFVQVYDHFSINPVFTKGYFDNIILKYRDSSNKKAVSYWDSIRPVPLLPEELRDYRRKDSLEVVRADPRYLDSLDRKRNKPNLIALITTGQTFTKEKYKRSIHIGGLLDHINFNTVEGTVLDFSFKYTKRFQEFGRSAITIAPYVRYGFSNAHFNAHLTTGYVFGRKFFNNVSLAGGKKVFQFNNANPISPQYNTFSTLQYEHNYMKIYEAGFGSIGYRREIGGGFSVDLDAQYQDRLPLANTTTTKWRDFKDRSFTDNYTFTRHQALVFSAGVRWQPGARYIEFPDQKVGIGSRYPTFRLDYTRGIKGVAGSDIDYSKWRFDIEDHVNLHLFGALDYQVAAGGFLNTASLFLPDYQHFQGNLFTVVSPGLNTFQLMPVLKR